MSSTTPWVPVLGAALLAGAAGGFVGRAMAPAAKASPAASSARPEAAAADTAALARRVEQLEQQAARLDRARTAERAPTGRGPAPGGEARPIVDDPVFEAAVRDVMDRLEEERRGERQTKREERQAQSAERWSQALGEKLGLSDAQKQKLAEIAQELSRQLRELRDSDAGSPTDERVRELRARGEARVAQVLDPRQMEKYGALDPGEKLGSGGRRGQPAAGGM